MSCFRNKYQNFDDHRNDDHEDIRDSIQWCGIKNVWTDFTYDCKNLMIDCGLIRPKEHVGKIVKVEPISGPVPHGYQGKCYHTLKMADGSQFKLKFYHINFEKIKHHLSPDQMIRITYKEPDYRVINVYPQRIYQTMEFEDFLEDYQEQINMDANIRVCFLNGAIQKIEFLDQGLVSETDSESDDTIEIVIQK